MIETNYNACKSHVRVAEISRKDGINFTKDRSFTHNSLDAAHSKICLAFFTYRDLKIASSFVTVFTMNINEKSRYA